MANNELHTDLRTAVRELCARFPDTYWRELDAKEAAKKAAEPVAVTNIKRAIVATLNMDLSASR